ncbi:hypothetical protein BSKO_06091 [Bryopsis sp. KO-2023]|nr:hypothetical protein BSKO_06091 [Bryopsis sp. KO-2023]
MHSRGEKVDWSRLMSLVFGATSLLLLFGFLSKARSLGTANDDVESLKQQLSRAQQETSQCRTNLNYMEQDVANKENAARSLRHEVGQYREQSDRLDNMLQGYRGQVHDLEVKLSKTEEECKKREEELEAVVAATKAEKRGVEQQVRDQVAIVHQITLEKDSVTHTLAETNSNLDKWRSAYLALNPPVPAPVPVAVPEAVPVAHHVDATPAPVVPPPEHVEQHDQHARRELPEPIPNPVPAVA